MGVLGNVLLAAVVGVGTPSISGPEMETQFLILIHITHWERKRKSESLF